MKNISCISWNTAKRTKYINKQVELIMKNDCDVVALQEVIYSSERMFKELLSPKYKYIFSSFDLVKDKSILNGKRMFGQLVASKIPCKTISPNKMNIPWTERVLTVLLLIEGIKIYFYTTHIPPGSSNGWIKIEMINGIVRHLINNKKYNQILCGDFNTPKHESLNNGLITFGQVINKNGKIKIKKSFRGGKGIDWDRGERSLFKDLKENDIIESYRLKYPRKFGEKSWTYKRKGKLFGQRFDHFFASTTFIVNKIKYIKLNESISDHNPIVAEFDLNLVK